MTAQQNTHPETQQEAKIGVRSIKVTASYLRSDITPEDLQALKINFGFRTQVVKSQNLIELFVEVVYWNDKPENRLASIQVQNTFFLESTEPSGEDLQSWTIPVPIMHTFLSMAISHTRALAAQHLTNTSLENFLLPPIPMSQIESFARNLTKP